MVRDFNNSRVSKNMCLESSYKAFDQPKIHDKIRLNQFYFPKGFLSVELATIIDEST